MLYILLMKKCPKSDMNQQNAAILFLYNRKDCDWLIGWFQSPDLGRLCDMSGEGLYMSPNLLEKFNLRHLRLHKQVRIVNVDTVID